MKKFIIQRKDGTYYAARTANGWFADKSWDADGRWTPKIEKARLYSHESFARSTIKEMKIPVDDVAILTLSLQTG